MATAAGRLELSGESGVGRIGGHEIGVPCSGQKFLSVLFEESRGGGESVKIKTLAQKLGTSCTYVKRIAGKLCVDGYTEFGRYGHIGLTSRGMDEGRYLLYRHITTARFLAYLRGSGADASELAGVEAALSRETLEAMEQWLALSEEKCDTKLHIDVDSNEVT